MGPDRHDELTSDFTTEPLIMAERHVRSTRRTFIDFDEFMASDKWERHHLVIGSFRNVYDHCHHLSLCDHSHAPYPLHSLARPYLDAICWLGGGEAPTIYDQSLLERVPPLYFAGPSSGAYACVDLTAAYWSLYRVASLDLRYDGVSTPRNGAIRFLGSDELAPHKLLRNAIVGTIRAETRTESQYGKVSLIPTGPKWRRPGLWGWIMDTLEAIAWEARMFFGAVHVQVDGYIVPAERAEELIGWLRDEWGLDATVRASGEGMISGLGHWSIGDVHKGADEGVDDSIGEGFVDPHRGGEEKVDNMAHSRMAAERVTMLREWFVAAQEYKNDTPKITSKVLDGAEVPW
jgi:hypothetical protein